MRRSLSFLLALFHCVILFSCQREASVEEPLGTQPGGDSTHIDSSAINKSLIREIHIAGVTGSGPIQGTLSIQYDTAASKITVLVKDNFTPDDSLTSIDVTGFVYEFNDAGYLMKSAFRRPNGTWEPDFVIQRNSANQIEKIIEYNAEGVNGVGYNDTIYYRYAGNTVEDSVHFQFSPGFSRVVMLYDAQQKIKRYQYYDADQVYIDQSFSYDGQGNVNQIVGLHDTTTYSYDAVLDKAWKRLPELFLGKDAYILMQDPATFRMGYNFLTFYVEERFETRYNPLFTAPLSHMHRQGITKLGPDDYQTSTVQFATTYENGKTKTITTTADDGSNLTYTFSN